MLNRQDERRGGSFSGWLKVGAIIFSIGVGYSSLKSDLDHVTKTLDRHEEKFDKLENQILKLLTARS